MFRCLYLRLPGQAAFLICLFAILGEFQTRAAELAPVRTANYKQANKWSREFVNSLAFEARINPQWIGKTDSFWYTVRTSQGSMVYKVDPKALSKQPLFDRVKLAAQLSELTKTPIDERQLVITVGTPNAGPPGTGGGGAATALPPKSFTLRNFRLTDDTQKIRFIFEKGLFEYDLQAEKLTKLGEAPSAQPPRFPGQEATQEEIQKWQQDMQKWRDEQDQFMQRFGSKKEEVKDEKKDEEKIEDKIESQKGKGNRKGGGFGGDYRNTSPDKKHYLYAYKYNLFLAESGKEKDAVQLTTDGVEDYSFGGNNTDRKARPNATWSKDSKSFFVTRSDSRNVQELFLVNALKEPRPSLEKYKYAMPGEDFIQKPELYYGDISKKSVERVVPKWKDESYLNVQFSKKQDELRFIRRDRLLRNIEFCSLNLATGQSKCLFEEGYEAAYLDTEPPRYLDDTDEMIWWSERSGWGHYYLYSQDGKLKNPITTGSYRCSRIVDVDVQKRVLYFEANGREENGSIYHRHLYRINLDGTGFTDLTPVNGMHTASISPSKQYLVDVCESVTGAPVAVLRDYSGNQLMNLETTDLARIKQAGWKPAETFTVKAADGITDLFGNMWKPFDFDPAKKYPIIAYVYPGPQMEGTKRTFSLFNNEMQLAQLGFIVVEVGHRGGTPERSKAYHSYGYFNLRDYALADKKTAIEQLALLNPWMDIDRVGIYGHSGGGFLSAAALLQKPYNEFFKAAVASAGNHDNNIYNNSWSERYHGLKEVPNREVLPPPREMLKSMGSSSTGTDKKPTLEFDFDVEEYIADLPDDVKKEILKGKDEGRKDEAKKDDLKKGEEKKGAMASVPDVKFEIKVPTNAELAANLKGALLLVHGDMDNNVHPANTIRLADALIKANKRFDMIILPGKRHNFADYQPYFQQRLWDHFADHLLGDRRIGADLYEKVKQ